jgi:hypothetical protein
MNETKLLLRAGAAGGAVAALLLLVLFVINVTMGADLTALEGGATAAQMTAVYQKQGATLQAAMLTDDLFVIAYTLAFLGVATLAREKSALLARVGLVFALGTAALDFIENASTLAFVQAAGAGVALDATQALLLTFLNQVKFLSIFLAAPLFAIGVWSAAKLNRALSVLFVLFPIVGVLSFVNPLALIATLVWMFALLALGAVVLWRKALTL